MIKIFGFLLQYNEEKWKYYLAALVICSLGLAAVTVWEPEILRQGVEAIGQKDLWQLLKVGIDAGIFVFLFMLLKVLLSLLKVKTQNDCRMSLDKRLIHKMLDVQKKEMDGQHFGEISTIIIDNVNKCSESALQTLVDFSAGIGVMIISMMYMLTIEWRLLIAILLYYSVIQCILRVITKKMKKNAEEVIEADKDGSDLLVSLLANMLTVRITSNKNYFGEQYKKKEHRIMMKNWKDFSWSNGQQDFIWASAKAAEYLIVYAVGILILGDVPLSTLFSFIFANDIFNNGVYQFTCHLESRVHAEAAIRSISDFLVLPEETGEEIQQYEKAFSIRFENVSFGYGEKMILENVNFSINPGEKVLLTGENGQGKSTLLKLMGGLYRPAKGKIFYGDMDTETVHIHSLTALYSYISQKSNMLNGDVCQNIALSDSYNSEEIHNILKDIQMSHCRNTPPDRLSMGEKQRINIARALYKKIPVFVLADEIFANVDAENREKIIELFAEKYQECTVIMIAHEKFNYPFDKVLYVGNGKVTECLMGEGAVS